MVYCRPHLLNQTPKNNQQPNSDVNLNSDSFYPTVGRRVEFCVPAGQLGGVVAITEERSRPIRSVDCAHARKVAEKSASML